MSNVIINLCLVVLLTITAGAGTVSAQSELEHRLDSLFVIASSAEIHYQDMREPAMDEIAAYGAEAVGYLIDRFSTKSSWERWTVIWIFQRIGAPAIPGLLNALGRQDGMIVQRVCWALGDVGDSTAVKGLIQVTDHPRWQVRDMALEALGKIGDPSGADASRLLLADTIGQVRKSAVVTCGQLKVNEAISDLVYMLDDDFYGARLMAINTLLQLDTIAVVQAVAGALPQATKTAGHLMCDLLGQIGSDEAMKLLISQVKSSDPVRRAHAAVALVKADPLDNCQFRAGYYDQETDRLVRLKIESAIKTAQDELGSN